MTTHRQQFQSAVDTYFRAQTPTSQIVHGLAASFAQMIATDCGGKTAVILPGKIKIERGGNDGTRNLRKAL